MLNHNNKTAAIILHYKQKKETIECIKSLYKQVDKIIVVDNSNNLPDNIMLTNPTFSELDKNFIKIIKPEKNLGFGKGMQHGLDLIIQAQQYRAVLIINNDAIASDNMIKRMLPLLDTYNDSVLIAPRMLAASTPSLLWYHRIFALVLQKPAFGAFAYLSGACLFIPVSLLTTINPFFDPDFFMYGEDVELSWRMKQANVALIVADANCTHEGSASSQRGSLFYEYHVAKGHLLLMKKLANSYLDWTILLIGRIISLPLRATLRCMRYRNLVAWHALVLACLGKAPTLPDS